MRKKIVIAGGSGFLGTALTARLLKGGYDVVVLSRGAASTRGGVRFVQWDGVRLGDWARELDGCSALINFTGKSINAIYTKKVREEILSSRLDSVHVLHEAIAACTTPPRAFIQASAVGIYGNTKVACDESAPVGSGFLAEVCRQWEAAFTSMGTAAMRQVILRIGFVLGRDGGALEPLQKLTKLYLGGTVGKGDQYISWIHIDDLMEMFVLAIESEAMQGVYNATAPRPVANKTLMRALRKAMGKGWGLPAPIPIAWLGAYVLMRADPSLALEGTNAIPQRMLEMKYAFRYRELDIALADLFAPRP